MTTMNLTLGEMTPKKLETLSDKELEELTKDLRLKAGLAESILYLRNNPKID